MNVTSKIALLVGLFLISFGASASEIGSCLAETHRQSRVIDQKQMTESCFQENIKKIDKKQCFDLVKRNSLAQKNSDLQESLNSTCFYQAGDFSDVKSCLSAAGKLKIADNHDEAVFECYRQFQAQVSRPQCIEISRKLIYPSKKNYLLRHCQNNY